ncbi:unnamed protein product [Strongylus vulgaris]|uniref:protein-ribulosamine 3-kinase n=1 Tax=Strongylus vulgaris TaxID=40348 RepID=A0A3P7K0L9_STRVU|nr:unnamed protein product [Strongylus vulgaris]
MGGGNRQDLVQLGSQLARMHKHNEDCLKAAEHSEGFVGGDYKTGNYKQGVNQFGFHTTTCCGFIPQNNEWSDDWASFFVRNRLKLQADLLIEKGDRDMREAWPELERKATDILASCKGVTPALVHGDLWGGNWASCDSGPGKFSL